MSIGPICSVLPIAPSTYYAYKAPQADVSLQSTRSRRDAELRTEIQRVWDENRRVYGVRKVWRELKGEGISVARCTVARLMRQMGLRGAVRGRRLQTTMPADEAEPPLDLVDRDFRAERPNELWVSDLTSVATGRGFVYRSGRSPCVSAGVRAYSSSL